jgi:hypothetical protein
MAPLLDSASRHAQELGLARAAVVALIVLAVVIAASIAFGWTLTEGPVLDLTTDPAGELPF